MKRKLIMLYSIAIPLFLSAQVITLDSCLSLAVSRYPLVKQYGLIEKTVAYNVSNINKAWLPQFNLSAKATYQSDVTGFPEELGTILTGLTGRPVSFESLSQDQYQAVIEMQQTIWDGGMSSARKQAVKATAEVEKQQLTVELYSLNDRVRQLYFGILLIDGQLKQSELLKNELTKNLKRVNAGIQQGVAQQSDADAVKVGLIKTLQHETELMTINKSYRQMLGAFIGIDVTSNTQLKQPILPEIAREEVNKRPELMLFDAQRKALEAQTAGYNAALQPKLGLFAQGGYANPALNMFDPGFNTYYVAGVRLNWNLSEFYNKKNNNHKTALSMKSVEVQKETFLFNNQLVDKQQLNEIERLQSLLKSDEEIIALQQNIKKSSEVKYTNGTITVNDLLKEITAESIAEQTRMLHELQLYMAVYQFKSNTNN